MGIDEQEHIEVSAASEFRAWLSEHHSDSPGIWVVTHKKISGLPAPTYDELVREALCFGWVDSKSQSVDAMRTKLYLTPRKKGSNWAPSNKERVEQLIAEGKMARAGMKVIESAQADGSWG